MLKRLLGTTALLGAAFGANMMVADDAMAQRQCPPSSLQGAGNVSNAACNYLGLPVPFTMTLHANAAELMGWNGNAHLGGTAGPGSGSPNNGWGFLEQAWIRLLIDAAGQNEWHYGFYFALFTQSPETPNTTTGSPTSIASQVDREYLYVKNPRYGQVQIGTGPSGATANFPFTLGPGSDGWAMPGAAINNIGPNNGVESMFFLDPTASYIDGKISAFGGADGVRNHGAFKVRYISPNFGGSSEDTGFHADVLWGPDATGHNEAIFSANNLGGCSIGNTEVTVGGIAGCPGTGEGSSANQFGSFNERWGSYTEDDVYWEEIFAKDFDVNAGVGVEAAWAKNGTNIKDAMTINTGIALTYKENLNIGGGFTYGGKTGYATDRTPVSRLQESYGFSFGAQYDWDRYQVGGYFEHAIGQGFMGSKGSTSTTPGHIELNYIAFGGSIQILKGLKLFNEEVVYFDHATGDNVTVAGLRSSSSGLNIINGISLDF